MNIGKSASERYNGSASLLRMHNSNTENVFIAYLIYIFFYFSFFCTIRPTEASFHEYLNSRNV